MVARGETPGAIRTTRPVITLPGWHGSCVRPTPSSSILKFGPALYAAGGMACGSLWLARVLFDGAGELLLKTKNRRGSC